VWSPRSDRIAFSVEARGAFMIRDGFESDQKPRAAPDSLPEPFAPPETGEGAFRPSSWAPDGVTIAGSMNGIVLYDIETRRYRRLTRFGHEPVWLPDGQHLLFADDRRIFVLSTRTGEPREIYSAEPNGPLSSIALTSDGRAIFTTLSCSGEEIWTARVPEEAAGSPVSGN
jgi:WD40 repeat protein